VTVLKAPHASDILIVIQVIGIIHLLDRLDPLRQEAADSAMLSLALLAEAASSAIALADYVAPLVALVADCPLRASVAVVTCGQAEEAAGLVQAGVVMVSDLLASEAAHVAFEVPIDLPIFLLLDRIVLGFEGWLLPVGLLDLHHQVGSLRAASLIRPEDLVGVHGHAGWRFALQCIVALYDLQCGPAVREFFEQLLDEHEFLLLGEFVLI
jgi:hypothetical protein